MGTLCLWWTSLLLGGTSAGAPQAVPADRELTNVEIAPVAGQVSQPAGATPGAAPSTTSSGLLGPRMVRITSEGPAYRVYGFTAGQAAGAAATGAQEPLRGPASTLVPLCTTPCEVPLYPATYVLALGHGENGPVESRPFEVTPATRELVASVGRRPGQLAGTLVLLGTVVAAIAASRFESDWTLVEQSCSGTGPQICHSRSVRPGWGQVAIPVAVIGGAIGVSMLLIPPRASLDPR